MSLSIAAHDVHYLQSPQFLAQRPLRRTHGRRSSASPATKRTAIFASSTFRVVQSGKFRLALPTIYTPEIDKLRSCKLPNVNPDDGIRHKEEPDYALRHLRDVDPGAKGMGCLGVQMVPVFPDASTAKNVDELSLIISAGMALEVQETGEHVYIKQ